MRGRVVVAIPLLLTLLAGCITDEDPVTDLTLTELPAIGKVTPGLYESHPAYAYPTTGMLETAAEGAETRIVNPDGTITWLNPAKKELPASIGTIEGVTHVDDGVGSAGIAVFGPLAFMGGRGQGPLQVVDISDPTAAKIVGTADNVPVRDADTILYPDGRLVVITTSGGTEQFVTDVSDPANPEHIATMDTDGGNHNIFVVPGTPIVYNSGGKIVDYTDPENPLMAGEVEGTGGCHDITFFNDNERSMYRAYCAGYSVSQIWDTADPLNPKVLIDIDYPNVQNGVPVVGGMLPDTGMDAPLSFSHLAMVNHDGSVLIVGDETGGGAINGCDVGVNAAGTTVSGPYGNLWFYDISDEQKPVLKGHVSPSFVDALGGSCTAHFGRVIEDTGLLVMGFYAAGVALVDFNDLDNPAIIHRFDHPTDPTSSIWDVQYHQGYLFTGDMSRGMDVLTLS